jgi:hypothetical protein
MSAIPGADFLLEVEQTPNVWVYVENFNAFMKKGAVPETFDPVFDLPMPIVSPGVLEETFSIGGFFDPLDPGQAVLRAAEANHTPVNIRYYKDGVQGESQFVYIAGFTQEAKAAGELQTIVYDLTALRPSVVPPPPNPVTSGLIGWYAADNLTTLNHLDLVPSWPDASGLANDVAQPTPANRPQFIQAQQNGRPVVRFNGTNWLSRANGGLPALGYPPHTLIIAAIVHALTPDHYKSGATFGTGTTNTSSVGVTDGAGYLFVGGASNGDACGTGANDDVALLDAPHILSKLMLNDGGPQSVAGYADGRWLTPGDATTLISMGDSGITIGGSTAPASANAFNGDLFEALMYNRVLTPTEHAQVEQYLSTKWNIRLPVIAQDTVRRADSLTSPGTMDTGQAWSVVSGTWGIASHLLYVVTQVSANDDAIIINTGLGDVTVWAIATVAGQDGAILFRQSDQTHGWRVIWESGTLFLEKRNGTDAYSQVLSVPLVVNNTDRIMVQCGGDAITVFVNETQKLAVHDAFNQTATWCGLAAASTATRFGSFLVTKT